MAKVFSPNGIDEATFSLKRGDHVTIRDAEGEDHQRIAVTGVIRGSDFLVVWVCRAEEWAVARSESREPDGIPWPATDVRAASESAVGASRQRWDCCEHREHDINDPPHDRPCPDGCTEEIAWTHASGGAS